MVEMIQGFLKLDDLRVCLGRQACKFPEYAADIAGGVAGIVGQVCYPQYPAAFFYPAADDRDQLPFPVFRPVFSKDAQVPLQKEVCPGGKIGEQDQLFIGEAIPAAKRQADLSADQILGGNRL